MPLISTMNIAAPSTWPALRAGARIVDTRELNRQWQPHVVTCNRLLLRLCAAQDVCAGAVRVSSHKYLGVPTILLRHRKVAAAAAAAAGAHRYGVIWMPSTSTVWWKLITEILAIVFSSCSAVKSCREGSFLCMRSMSFIIV
jgi:hypothetical protein